MVIHARVQLARESTMMPALKDSQTSGKGNLVAQATHPQDVPDSKDSQANISVQPGSQVYLRANQKIRPTTRHAPKCTSKVVQHSKELALEPQNCGTKAPRLDGKPGKQQARKSELKDKWILSNEPKSAGKTYPTKTATKTRRSLAKALDETRAKVFKCDQCSFETLNKNSFGNHKRSRHGRDFVCSMCDFHTGWNSMFLLHMRKHSKKEGAIVVEKPGDEDTMLKNSNCKTDSAPPKAVKEISLQFFKCDECSYKTSKEVSLRKHQRRKHGEDFTCTICNYKTGWKSLYQKHYLEKHNTAGLNIQRAGSSTIGSMRQSVKTVDRSPWGVIFPPKTNGKKKASNCVTQSSLFSCTDCSYSSHQRSNLKRHMKTHSRNKAKSNPATGNKSKPKANSKGNLAKSAWRTWCFHCPFMTKYPHNLIRHEKTHKEDRKKEKSEAVRHEKIALQTNKSPDPAADDGEAAKVAFAKSLDLNPACPTRYVADSVAGLRKHRRHLQDEDFRCPGCDLTSGCKSVITCHLERHPGHMAATEDRLASAATFRSTASSLSREAEVRIRMEDKENCKGYVHHSYVKCRAGGLEGQGAVAACGDDPSDDEDYDDDDEYNVIQEIHGEAEGGVEPARSLETLKKSEVSGQIPVILNTFSLPHCWV